MTYVLRTDEERAVLDELRRAGVFVTVDDAVRTAIWRLADHFDIPMSTHCFALSTGPQRAVEDQTPSEQPSLFADQEGTP